MVGLRLSALRLPPSAGGESIGLRGRQGSGTWTCRENDSPFVIAGLDPAIHADEQHARSAALVRRTSAWTTASSPVATREGIALADVSTVSSHENRYEAKRGTRGNRALYLRVEDAENDSAWG